MNLCLNALKVRPSLTCICVGQVHDEFENSCCHKFAKVDI